MFNDIDDDDWDDEAERGYKKTLLRRVSTGIFYIGLLFLVLLAISFMILSVADHVEKANTLATGEITDMWIDDAGSNGMVYYFEINNNIVVTVDSVDYHQCALGDTYTYNALQIYEDE